MILPSQDIKRLCVDGWLVPDINGEIRKMIEPFEERGEFAGRTYGLGPCTYDFRLDHVLGEHGQLATEYVLRPNEFVLASTIEKVAIPYDVCGTVLDKSSNAREGITAFNTHFDPGFVGYPTLELANLSNKEVILKHGMAIVQFKFEYLFRMTDMPYRGKYNNQPAEPTKAKESTGVWS